MRGNPIFGLGGYLEQVEEVEEVGRQVKEV